MSTDIQLKGDSRRRQLEASKAYATANGLDLAEDAQLEDIGVSAFKGKNVRQGALGRFLEAVQRGLVAPGSYLIVESLDRISRDQVMAAQSLFLSIVQAGIVLVTLADGRTYRKETVDLGDLIMSLVIMSRAHEESQTKSHRLKAAWKNKRDHASVQPMTRRCAAWLRLSDDRSHYEVIEERAEIVRQIFRDSASGVGMYSIANRLNRAGIPAFVGKAGWHKSSVDKTLANRAAIGEFQAHVLQDGKRIREGEPIKAYFPAIIDEQLFYQAQLGRTQRKVSGRGRKGKAFTNLFSGLATCAYCQGKIGFENKGSGSKGGAYLVCDSAVRGMGCPATRWRYGAFEAAFLAFVEELDIDGIMNASEQASTQQALTSEVSAIKGELSIVADMMEKTYAVLNGGGPVDFVTAKLAELDGRRVKLTDALKSKNADLESLKSRETRYRRSKDEIKRLVEQLQSQGSDELFKIRANIASQLKSLVGTLRIGSVGEMPRLSNVIGQARSAFGAEADHVLGYMEQLAQHPDQSRRYFAVGFRDGSVRVVYPSQEDPLRYERQAVASYQNSLDLIDADGFLKI